MNGEDEMRWLKIKYAVQSIYIHTSLYVNMEFLFFIAMQSRYRV